MRNLIATLSKILCAVVEHLGAGVRRRSRPRFSFASRFHRVADVFAIAEWSFAEQAAIRATHFHAVSGVRTSLLASDVELYSTIDCRNARLFRLDTCGRLGCLRCRQCGRALEPLWFQIFDQPLASAFAAVAALAIAAKSAGSVKQVGAIYPNDARLQLCGGVQRHVDALAPDTSSQAVDRVVRQLHSFSRSAKGHRRQNGPEDFLLRDDRRRMHVAQQRRRVIKAARWQHHLGLPASRAFRHALIDESPDPIELYAGHNGTNVNCFIERSPDP